ncbi:MAG: hypothetical protein IPM53_18085 [Anaerolineaceae bacterium]|nr:hypothetical protein [Anaerolineaceae bacterium]
MTISNFFTSTCQDKETHNWILNAHNTANGDIDRLAKILAVEIVKFRCRRCPQHFNSWKNKAENDIPLSEASKSALRAFLVPTFGDPDEGNDPNIDHLEGFVGEWLWYFICTENPIDTIIHKVPPGFKSTDPGGDALLIHRLLNDELLFRLWEMKKFAPRKDESGQQIDATVNRAYSQLNSKALEYLARITATEQELNDPEVEEFVGKLVELWIDASPQAAAGVSIATSSEHTSQSCFDNFGLQFPRLTNPNRLLGMLTGIEDFSKFAVLVKEYVWKGL